MNILFASWWLTPFLSCRPGRRNTPNTRSCPDSISRMSTLWHVTSLLFAANPVRSHREWAGVIDRINMPEPSAPQSASPRVGAIIRCLHRDFHSPNTHGRYQTRTCTVQTHLCFMMQCKSMFEVHDMQLMYFSAAQLHCSNAVICIRLCMCMLMILDSSL